MSTSYLRRPQGRIAYEVHGSDGPLIICVHGMGDLSSNFRFTVPALLGAGYRVATLDLRGHGDSDDGFDRYDDEALSSDILALIDHLGGAPALVIGSSMGAAAGVLAAAEQPSKIAGLALVGPFVRNPRTKPIMALLQRLLLVKPWGPSAWTAYYRNLYPGRKPADLAEQQQRIRASLGRGDHWRSFVRTTRTDHTAAEQRLGDVRTPALVVMGERDPDFPDPAAEARFAADRLGGGAEVLMVAESGHYPMADSPDVVNKALVSFADKAFRD
jgi:pimeloyl-ACP methyl ester carboxylesterase